MLFIFIIFVFLLVTLLVFIGNYQERELQEQKEMWKRINGNSYN